MTIPHTEGRAESPRGIETNGIGSHTTAHLNLTKNMCEQIYAEAAGKSAHVTMGRDAVRRRVEALEWQA